MVAIATPIGTSSEELDVPAHYNKKIQTASGLQLFKLPTSERKQRNARTAPVESPHTVALVTLIPHRRRDTQLRTNCMQ